MTISKRVWKNGKQVVVDWTKPEDVETMIEFYEARTDRLDGLTGEKLVVNIEYRVYTEWCLLECSGEWDSHQNYHGQAFKKWVNDELHYHLERNGYKLKEDGKFDIEDKELVEARDAILHAVVKRGIDFFGKCRKYKHVPEGSKENLRVSLEPYLS